MARPADAARIDTARRAAAIARLIGTGEVPDRAAVWVARWERESEPGNRDRAAWERFDGWLAAERAAGRQPSGSVRAGAAAVRDRPAIDRPEADQPGRHEE